MRSYGQYCPVARASEVMAERWTPLVVRNLMFGAETFTELAHGVPQMSRSMLVTRLRELERAGVVERSRKPEGSGYFYRLTEAGRDLSGVIDRLAEWGERWVEIGPEESDPGFALWAWCQVQLDRAALPRERTVVAFEFPDQPVGNRRFWLLVEGGDAQVCYADPGGEPAARVRADSPTFVAWHCGRTSWAAACRTGRIEVTGSRSIARALPGWNLREPRLTRGRVDGGAPRQRL